MIELTIDRLTNGGRGCGRMPGAEGGKAVFVPLTAPGDVVRCRIVKEKKRFAEAELVEVLQPGPDRILPDCPHFGGCGGCQWQHLPYEVQVATKEQVFTDLLERQAGVDPALIGSALTADNPWNYRGRAQFKCRQTAQGFKLGFYRPNSHHVVDIETCPVIAQPLNVALALFRSWLPDAPDVDRITQLDLAVGADNRLQAMVHTSSRNYPSLRDYLKPLCADAGVLLALRPGPNSAPVEVLGEDDLFIEVDDPVMQLRFGAGGFVQVNQAQNRRMVAEVLDAAGSIVGQRVLDLYCGIGNFSLPLARRAGPEGLVVGVEDYAPAIESAKQNATRAGLKNTEFYARDAAGAVTHLWETAGTATADGTAGRGGFDLVVLDPPRAGAIAAVRELVTLRPAKVIYVSCDPATLARDLKVLLDGGYQLLTTRPIDMFPQTFHIESVSVLILPS